MQLQDYYSQQDDSISFSRRQASDFAKQVAGDFNPIHDIDAKRFCVPGDLLFSVVLEKYGLSQHMRFTFAGMVNDGVALLFPDSDAENIDIVDADDRKYLSLERSGDNSRDPALVHDLTCSYVQFSGQTFPHILVPLMSEQQVMINPDRPLVIYESMSIDLERLDFGQAQLELDRPQLEVNGKRGNVRLGFSLKADGEQVGHGEKTMVISGLRAHDAERVQAMVDDYNTRKQAVSG
ncbi:MAG TPA: DUF3581 family protein [Gammaproteobacteria bacterium]|nr:DUF3581 family protein [Gammaproteobacteria bacterium]